MLQGKFRRRPLQFITVPLATVTAKSNAVQETVKCKPKGTLLFPLAVAFRSNFKSWRYTSGFFKMPQKGGFYLLNILFCFVSMPGHFFDT